MTDRDNHEVRGAEEVRGESLARGNPLDRGKNRSAREESARKQFLARGVNGAASGLFGDDLKKEDFHMPNIINLAGKEVGDPIVVFPDTIAGGSFVPGTLIRIVDDWLIQISVGTVAIQDGAWRPVAPFVAGDQVFVPIRKIDAIV